MLKITELRNQVEHKLTDGQGLEGLERWYHTQRVVKKALELREHYGLNVTKRDAEIAALVHDYAKFETFEEQTPYPKTDHALLGADVVRDELGITDQEILDAVRYHTTGRPNMSDLEKLVFVSDFLEDGRTENSFIKARALQDLDKGIALILKFKMNNAILKRQALHELTAEAYDYYKHAIEVAREKCFEIISLLVPTYAKDAVIYDVRANNPLYDYTIILTTQSKRQMNASVALLKQSFVLKGVELGELWTLVDLGDCIVHLFEKEERERYRIDKLLSDLPEVAYESNH